MLKSKTTSQCVNGHINENNIRTSAVCIKSPTMNLIKSKAKELFYGTEVNK